MTYEGATLEWSGRDLSSITILENSLPVFQIRYEYNDHGYRTSKAFYTFSGGVPVLTETITYELIGNHVVYEANGTYAILFTYDYDGPLISFNYDANVLDAVNGTEYFYIRNQQGDITHLVDSTGVVRVHYLYDAYGTITYQTPSQSIGEINPYRYRGYRYDEELSWYYLNSRYYSADTGRFLNSDGLLGEFGSILSTNMYVYCANNPVMYVDPSGEFPVLISLLAIAVATYMTYGAVKSYNTSKDLGYSGWDLAGYTASGLIAGDYFVVRDSWDIISQNIIPGYNATDDPYINFDFTKNKYYSIFTAGLYAKHLHSNYYVEGRTVLGLCIELQVHYVFDEVARPFGITNGNPAWLGAPDLNGDWTAWIFEGFARGLKPISPVMPRIYR